MAVGPATDVKELSDEDLLSRMLAGDEAAFTSLYRRHQGRIYRFALGMIGSTAAAEEVTQEVFLGLLDGRVHYDSSKGKLAAFLVGVSRNQVLGLIRRESRFSPDSEETASAAIDPDTYSDLARRETIESVRQAVLSLPPNYREVVALCDLEEADYAEAAAVLGCPIGTVRSRLHRARVLLAEKLRIGTPISARSRNI